MSATPPSSTPPSSTPPSGWYPDPGHQGMVRYWDGANWTQHTAPGGNAGAAATAPVPRKGMSGGTIAAIVVGSIVLVLFIVMVLAAIAVPVFLNQREKAADAAAQASVQEVAAAIATLAVDNPNEIPQVEAMGSAVWIQFSSGADDVVSLEQGVAFGGFSATSPDDWCVWVTADRGHEQDWMYSPLTGVSPGQCEPSFVTSTTVSASAPPSTTVTRESPVAGS